MGLTDAEQKFYDQNGYVLKKGLITSGEISHIEREIAGLHERMAENAHDGVGISWEEFEDEHLPRRIRQLMHSEVISEGLNLALRCDDMLDIIEGLIGSNISLYHSKLLMKAARDGTAIPWHQDYAYWKREDNRPLMVNCQLAIDGTDDENGCIQFIPGSHKWGPARTRTRTNEFWRIFAGTLSRAERRGTRSDGTGRWGIFQCLDHPRIGTKHIASRPPHEYLCL